MDDIKEIILDWLRDAHAMEQQAESMLSSFSDRLEHYPELKQLIDTQVIRTRSQQDLLKDHIEKCGGSVSAIKDLGAKVMGFAQSASGILVGDEVVKGAMSIYVFQQMKIASYTVLKAAAGAIDDPATITLCDEFLPAEIDMAQWLHEHLPAITGEFIARTANAEDTAKH